MQKQSLSDRRRGGFLTDPKVVPYVFVAPFVIYFLVVYLYPTIATILMSFQRIEGPTSVEWIGFKNYERLFSRNYIQALETTARYAFWDVVVLTSVPLFVAVLLHSTLVKFASFFKSLFFIPALTSIIVAGIVFRLAFGTLPTAPVNRLMALFGQEPRDWLMYADTGNLVLIVMTLWRWMGVNIIYYLSGIQAIPQELYEAAEIDGAGALSKFFHVFTESVALWQQNNPGGVGRTIVGYMYLMGFYKSNMGMASAVGLTLLVLVLGVNLIQLTLMGFFKKEA